MAYSFKDIIANGMNFAQSGSNIAKKSMDAQGKLNDQNRTKRDILQSRRELNSKRLAGLGDRNFFEENIYNPARSNVEHKTNPSMGDYMAYNAAQNTMNIAGPDAYKTSERQRIESENEDLDRQLWQANEALEWGSEDPRERVMRRAKKQQTNPYLGGGFPQQSLADTEAAKNEILDEDGQYDENGNLIYTLQGERPDEDAAWDNYVAKYMFENPKIHERWGDDFNAFATVDPYDQEQKELWREYMANPETQQYYGYIMEDPRYQDENGNFDFDKWYDTSIYNVDWQNPAAEFSDNINDYTQIYGTSPLYANTVNAELASILANRLSDEDGTIGSRGMFAIDADAPATDDELNLAFDTLGLMQDENGGGYITKGGDVLTAPMLQSMLNQASMQGSIYAANNSDIADALTLNELNRLSAREEGGWNAGYRYGAGDGYESVQTPVGFDIASLQPYRLTPAQLSGLYNGSGYIPGYTEYAYDAYIPQQELAWKLRNA